MTYAIIRAGGHQEKVSPGEQIVVDRLKQDVGEEVTFTPLVIARDGGEVVTDKKALEEANASVVGTVVQHLKGDKVDIFMYRNKTGYRRHTGHRQPLTAVKISEIRFGEDVFRAPDPEPEPVPAEPGAGKTSEAKTAAKRGRKKAATGK